MRHCPPVLPGSLTVVASTTRTRRFFNAGWRSTPLSFHKSWQRCCSQPSACANGSAESRRKPARFPLDQPGRRFLARTSRIRRAAKACGADFPWSQNHAGELPRPSVAPVLPTQLEITPAEPASPRAMLTSHKSTRDGHSRSILILALMGHPPAMVAQAMEPLPTGLPRLFSTCT